MASRILYTLHHWLRPSLVALFKPNIAWDLRWRLLLLQPLSLITYAVSSVPYLFSRPFTVEWLPFAPGKTARVLVYKHTGGTAAGPSRRLRPVHVDIHGGAFIGGQSESTAPIDERVARETGAVVLGLTYPFAPENVFPAGIDEVDVVIQYIVEHAEERWGANPELLTVGGFSAGGNLATLASTQQPARHGSSRTAFKGCVLFCGVLELRLSPWQKLRPEGMQAKDPVAVLMPLFDAYPEQARKNHFDDPRLSPMLAARETLPPRILLCVPGVDILLEEQMTFAERINEEDRNAGELGRVEVFLEKDQNHAYLELPDMIVKPEIKERAWNRAVAFLRDTYALHDWTWTA
ncbi:hypothetical protein V2G26_001593 [Clonostachys chloroleuca]